MREFNITGSIIPEEHYYVDLKPQLDKLMQLVEKKKYFVINRPRQYGKTTLLEFLTQHLQTTGLYAPVFISFEGFTQRTDITEVEFYGKLTKLIFDELASFNFDPTESNLPTSKISNRHDFLIGSAKRAKICRKSLFY